MIRKQSGLQVPMYCKTKNVIMCVAFFHNSIEFLEVAMVRGLKGVLGCEFPCKAMVLCVALSTIVCCLKWWVV